MKAATTPTLYFIGVTTENSSIIDVFPKWADALGLKDTVISGIDLPIHAPVEDYRDAVAFLKEDPLSMGALVTTHKIDLFNACRDMFDYIDPYAQMLGEVSCLSKRDGKFCAHAKDPISSGLALENFVPENFWVDYNGEVVLLGAGGSSLAMSMYFAQEKFASNVPRKITICNRSIPRLESAKTHLENLFNRIDFEFVHTPSPQDNDAVIAKLPPYSLVVNATGLGKDMPGSPTTDNILYPKNSLVWEINYRGELLFKQQALAQKDSRAIHVEDGWKYFIFGWTQVISEVFNLPIEKNTLDRLADIAKHV